MRDSRSSGAFAVVLAPRTLQLDVDDVRAADGSGARSTILKPNNFQLFLQRARRRRRLQARAAANGARTLSFLR